MYRLVVETLLGVNREGERLRLTPRLRAEWPSYKVHYRFHETVYHITISRNTGGTDGEFLTLDGQRQSGSTITLIDDRREHFAELTVT
jgi:cellobiose phosphorylase